MTALEQVFDAAIVYAMRHYGWVPVSVHETTGSGLYRARRDAWTLVATRREKHVAVIVSGRDGSDVLEEWTINDAEALERLDDLFHVMRENEIGEEVGHAAA